MDIKVGEYVRTPEQGFIGKLVKTNKSVLNYYKIDVGREIRRPDGYSDNYIYSRDGFGLKHSKNIIDLIEKGDYVNGFRVLEVKKVPNEEIDRVVVFDDSNVLGYECEAEEIYKKDIKEILTHEQYESNCYRLED